MTSSQLFKQAHAMTKQVIQTGDNYAATFGLCLKAIKAEQALQAVKTVTIKAKTLAPIFTIIYAVFAIITAIIEDAKAQALKVQAGKMAESVFSPLRKRAKILAYEGGTLYTEDDNGNVKSFSVYSVSGGMFYAEEQSTENKRYSFSYDKEDNLINELGDTVIISQ